MTSSGLGPLYPVGLVVRDQRCLVVGGGRVAARKIESLLACGAAVTVVAPEVHEALRLLSDAGAIDAIEGAPLDVQLRMYELGEAAGYRLVVTATGDRQVDGVVHADAEAAGVWVNSADDPAHCSFVLPAVWRQGTVSVAVSTGGSSPALASWMARRVAHALGDHVGELADLLADARRQVQARGVPTESVDWQGLLDGELPQLVEQGRTDEARSLVEAAIRADQGRN